MTVGIPSEFVCPQGHCWRIEDRSDDDTLRCPICGDRRPARRSSDWRRRETWASRRDRSNPPAEGPNHPNIVPVLPTGRHEGAESLASEFVKGANLSEYHAGRPVPVVTAAEIVETLARAVHEAHRQGFCHGDLNAARVLLAPSHPPRFVDPELGHLCEENGRELIPRITGFGMAGTASRTGSDSPVRRTSPAWGRSSSSS